MKSYNHTWKFGLGIGVFLIMGVAATRPPGDEKRFTNLKIIPKNIDDERMDQIMNKMSHDLSVSCNYCHADSVGVFPPRIDFSSDAKKNKLVAREMMKMTDRINKKYFNFNYDYQLESSKKQPVTCKTCHRGFPKPNDVKLYNFRQKN
ncbi:MAG: c-type cytochrome [Bacteroidetes bacterium]|nr:MAG: c-type cytochrome [Bacteroidota bacterium]